MNTNTPLPFKSNNGSPEPYGIHFKDDKINFSLFSKHAKKVTLCLFKINETTPLFEIPLHPEKNKTGNVWHIELQGLNHYKLTYAYKLDGPHDVKKKHHFDGSKFVLDPYAKQLEVPNKWGDFSSYQPKGLVAPVPSFDWEGDSPLNTPVKELVVYEMHVRGFTDHSSSNVKNPGTYSGMIEKIPHLVDLGINAVELLPFQEFNEKDCVNINPKTGEKLVNYWGYNSINFFAPMHRFSSCESAVQDFRSLVKELHRNQINVILDVVFNHTGEGNHDGPNYSFKGIDNSIYYILGSDGHHQNYSGCGNTFNCNHPIVRRFILDCLRWWVTDLHVDGFRFDLASIFYRNTHGKPMHHSPLVEAISEDPILAHTLLIAEPWDAGGLYQVGNFYPHPTRWSEWNGKYRDSIRQFIKGDPGKKGEFSHCLCGSKELFGHERTPQASINFITSHDGFTLNDLVSYNDKHNQENGDENRDGMSANDSWNSGVEGNTKNQKILYLRNRQMRNFHLALMISQGIPMILMGDEYGHTKGGNNNTWCQDNKMNWFLWDELNNKTDFFRYYRLLIHFRKRHPILQRDRFLEDDDIEWHGFHPGQPNWENGEPFTSFTLIDKDKGHHLYAAFNAMHHQAEVQLPDPPEGKHWHWIVNTANPSPTDILEEGNTYPVQLTQIKMIPSSALLLKAMNN